MSVTQAARRAVRLVDLVPSVQPFRDTLRGFALLRPLHRKTVHEPCSRCVRPKHREAATETISAMRDDGYQRLGRQIMGREEGPDHRRRGFSPDRKTEKDRLIGRDARYACFQGGLIT